MWIDTSPAKESDAFVWNVGNETNVIWLHYKKVWYHLKCYLSFHAEEPTADTFFVCMCTLVYIHVCPRYFWLKLSRLSRISLMYSTFNRNFLSWVQYDYHMCIHISLFWRPILLFCTVCMVLSGLFSNR